MGKSDDVTEAMSREEMKRLFRMAREQPIFAALALDKGGAALLLLDKRKPDTALDRQMRAEAPAATGNRRGSVMIDPDDARLAVFTVNKPAPGMARKLVKSLKGTGVSRVRFRLEDGTICDSADDESPAEAADAPPGTPARDPEPDGQSSPLPDADGVKALLVEQVNRIAGALAEDPSRREGLVALAKQGRDHLAAGDLEATEADIAALARALDQPPDPGAAGNWPQALALDPEPDSVPPLTLVGYSPGAPGQAPGGPKPKPAPIRWMAFKAFIPKNTRTVDEMYRIFEVVAYGRVTNSKWTCGGYCDMSKNQGKVVPFQVPDANVAANRDPAATSRAKDDKAALNGVGGAQKTAIETEAARRYVRTSGELPGPDAHKDGTGQADVYDRAVSSVMQDRAVLKTLPAEVAALLGGKSGEYDPKNYTQLLRITGKLKSFSPEDLALYKTLPLKAADNLDVFEKSLDVFLQRKAELLKAIQDQQAQQPGPQADPVAAVWNGFDGTKLATMSEDQRETLARQKANEVAEAQLKQLADHPGDALKGLAKSATLLNTGETMDAIGKDIAEAADGDANAYARWGAGTGAGAKLSGWLLAVAGVVYVASWLTGVGELATIGAAAGYALGAMLTLSVAEEELRIKAASKETDPEKYKHDVEAAGQARLTIALTAATLVVAAVLHFTAKALFPNQVAKLKATLKNFRDRVAKGPVAPLKPPILQELAAHKAEFGKSGALAKAQALDSASTLEALSTEDFVKRLQSDASGGILEHGKLPPDQKVDFAQLMKSAEGRTAIETYKAKLIKTLRTDVTAEIDRLTKQYLDGIEEAVKAIDAAKSHDDLAAATATLEDLLGEDHAKQFMKGEQDQLVKQKLLEGSAEARKDIEQAPATGAAKRVVERIANNPKFKLTYSTDELMAILGKAKQLGLSDKLVEDLILTGSREAKRLNAAELTKQMEDWASNVSKRGYPHKFASLDEFKQFGTDLKGELGKGGIPADDVRVQGSSLRNPAANDVDLSVFVDQAGFDKILIDRYDGKIAFTDKAPAPNTSSKISLAGKSHAELAELARDIEQNPRNYNSTAKTFMNAELNGQLNSKGDISAGLKAAAKTIAAKYPGLNIETISIEVKGGAFDLQPDLPIPTK